MLIPTETAPTKYINARELSELTQRVEAAGRFLMDASGGRIADRPPLAWR